MREPLPPPSSTRFPIFGDGFGKGVLVALIGVEISSFPFAISKVHEIAYNEDWANFWAAGATVGSRALLKSQAHTQWQVAHGLRPQLFVYPPGFAWFFAPFAHVGPLFGFIANAVLMGLIGLIGAVIATRVYGVSRTSAVLCIFAWYPVLYAIQVGQNAILGMTLTLCAILGIERRESSTTGLAVGALLYKPTYAVAFVLYLLLRRNWKSLSVVAAVAAGWYLLGTTATAGSWNWPVQYAQTIAGYYHGDFAGNAYKAMTFPTIVLETRLPYYFALLAGIAILCLGAIVCARRPIIEGASVLPLIGLASSPHAWPYDLCILIPCIFHFFARKRLRHPIYVAYIIAATWWITIWWLPFNPLAVLVIGSTIAWLADSVLLCKAKWRRTRLTVAYREIHDP